MKSVLTTSNPIHFNSELNIHSENTKTNYSEGTHKSEQSVMITTTDII